MLEKCGGKGEEEEMRKQIHEKVREILAGDGSGEKWMKEIEKKEWCKKGGR